MNLHNILPKAVRQAGFTMIELLVVIAVIGVLAVAVLSTINPIEQINKGRDTRSRADAGQLIGAIDRYFSVKEAFPWNVDSTEWTATSTAYDDAFIFNETGRGTFTEVTATTDWDWAEILSDVAEVKPAFITRLRNTNDSSEFVVHKEGTGNATLYVCYPPTSYQFASEARDRCIEDGDAFPAELETAACPTECTGSTDITTDPAETCWVCLP